MTCSAETVTQLQINRPAFGAFEYVWLILQAVKLKKMLISSFVVNIVLVVAGDYFQELDFYFNLMWNNSDSKAECTETDLK